MGQYVTLQIAKKHAGSKWRLPRRSPKTDEAVSEHFVNRMMEVCFGSRPNETPAGKVVRSATWVVYSNTKIAEILSALKIVAF